MPETRQIKRQQQRRAVKEAAYAASHQPGPRPRGRVRRQWDRWCQMVREQPDADPKALVHEAIAQVDREIAAEQEGA